MEIYSISRKDYIYVNESSPERTNESDLQDADTRDATTRELSGSSAQNTTREVFPNGALFEWHGTELIFISLMMVMGIIGNLLVFYIYHFRWRSNTVTLYKRMLAILDLANVGLALPPLLYLTIHPQDASFRPLCVFTSFIALGTAIASGGILVVIAADRFLKLCLLRKTGIGSRLSKQLFALSVVASCIINIPTGTIFGRDTLRFPQYKVEVSYCFIRAQSKSSAWFLGWAIVIGTIFVSITIALVVLYRFVIVSLMDLSNKHEELKRRPSLAVGKDIIVKQKQSELMRRSCIVFITITVVFFATYLPFFIALMLSMLNVDLETNMTPGLKVLLDLAKLCPLFNTVANPFIYSFTSKEFCKEVKKLLTCKAFAESDFFRRRAFSMGSSNNVIDRSPELSHFSE